MNTDERGCSFDKLLDQIILFINNISPNWFIT